MISLARLVEVCVETSLLMVISFSSKYWFPWIRRDVFPRILTVPFVAALFVSLLTQALWSGTRWGLVQKSPLLVRVIRSLRRFVIWLWRIAIGSAVVWILSVGVSFAWEQYSVRTISAHLTSAEQKFLNRKYLEERISQEKNERFAPLLFFLNFLNEDSMTIDLKQDPATKIDEISVNIPEFPSELKISLFVHAREHLTELKLIQDTSYVFPKKPEQFIPYHVLDNVVLTPLGVQVATYLLRNDPRFAILFQKVPQTQ